MGKMKITYSFGMPWKKGDVIEFFPAVYEEGSKKFLKKVRRVEGAELVVRDLRFYEKLWMWTRKKWAR